MKDQSVSILLVDNNEQEYQTTSNLLKQIGNGRFKLEWVSTYEDAQKKIDYSRPDICMLNYQSGTPSEREFLRYALKNSRHIPLILLADRADEQRIAQATEAGEAVDYLLKDQMNASLLERSIRYMIKFKQIDRALEQRVRERTVELEQELSQYRDKTEELKESEEQYRTLFNVDIYSVEVLDAEGRIIDCNPTFTHLLDYSRDEIIGKHTTDFASEQSKKLIEERMPHLKEWGYVEGEVELVRKDGTRILVWRRARALYVDGGTEIEHIVAYSRNITERMKAVKQISTLAQALEQNPVAVMITDTAGIVEYVNFRFSEMTEYAYEDAVGKDMETLLDFQEGHDDFDTIWRTLKAGEEWQGEVQSLQKSGELFWELVNIMPMFNPQGAMTHFIVSREDITERKRAEDESVKSQQRVGSLVSGHIDQLTAANEELQREINDRKRAEKALRQSRSRLRAQFKGIPIPTYSWQKVGKDFVLVDYNDAAEHTSHGRIADIMGKTAHEVFKDRPQVLADFSRCFNSKKMVKREAIYNLVATGEPRYFVTTYNFVPPNLIIVHIEDVTDYKKAAGELNGAGGTAASDDGIKEIAAQSQAVDSDEIQRLQDEIAKERAAVEDLQEKLAKSNARFKEYIDNIDDRLREQYQHIPIPAYSWQMIAGEFVLVDFNNAAAESMGKIVDFLGKPASEVFRDREQVLADFAACYEKKETVVREAPYKLVTTGETKFFVTTYNFMPPNLIIVHIQDITKYKQIEEELEWYRTQYNGNGNAAKISALSDLEQTQDSTKMVQVEEATIEGYAEKLAEVEEELQREVGKRQQVEQALTLLKSKIDDAAPKDMDKAVQERTQELQRLNEQLQQELEKHQRTADSLRDSRTRLRAQFKGLPVPTYSWQKVDKDFVLVDYNDAAEQETQGQIIEYMGKTASDVFKERREIIHDLNQVYNNESILQKEGPNHLVASDDSKYYTTTYSYVPPNLVIVYIEDMTRYKQMESALEASEEKIDLICRYSPEAKLTFVNDAYCWYFEQNRSDLIGRLTPFVVEEDRDRVQAQFIALNPEKPVGVIEYRVKKPSGGTRLHQWVNRGIFDDEGKLIEVRSVGRDITKRKQKA